MGELILSDLDEQILRELQKRAIHHGRTLADEAKAILSDTLQAERENAWAEVDAIYHRLEISGRGFSDSADLLREDRNRSG